MRWRGPCDAVKAAIIPAPEDSARGFMEDRGALMRTVSG